MGSTVSRFSGLVLAGLFSLGHAEAAIIDQGVTTLDTDTGLVWLDVNETSFWTTDSITAHLNSGGVFAGSSNWRHASGEELNSLLGHFGLVEVSTVVDTEFTTQNDALMFNALSTLGPTGISSDGESLAIRGVLEDIRFPDTVRESQWATRLVYHGNPDLISYTYLHYDSYRDSSGYPDIGHFLVQDAVVPSPVPVPAALPLFASALGVLGFFNMRRRKSAAS